MPEGLKVSPSALRDGATKITKKISEINGTLGRVTLQIQKLPDSYKGQSASEFMEKYSNLTKRYDAFKGAIEAYAKFLVSTANTYEETNQGIANLANQYLDE